MEIASAFTQDSEFAQAQRHIVAKLRAEWGVTSITTNLGLHGVTYGVDMDFDDYATVGMVLGTRTTPIFAEIEDGTYGQLQGIRIYKDAL